MTEMLLPRCTTELDDSYGEHAIEGFWRVMRFLEYLVEMFIQGFGITRPTEAQRKRVTLLLGSVLLAAVIFAIVAGAGMVFYLHTAR
jgi:hypothetical protein